MRKTRIFDQFEPAVEVEAMRELGQVHGKLAK